MNTNPPDGRTGNTRCPQRFYFVGFVNPDGIAFVVAKNVKEILKTPTILVVESFDLMLPANTPALSSLRKN